jgi:L-tyrosine isonitrile synthase
MIVAARQSKHAPSVKPAKRVCAVATPAAVIGAFNTWAFKRQQPSSIELLTTVVGRALELSAPLSFVLYWGKGPRAVVCAPERQCLDFLAVMGQRVADIYQPGAKFELLLTDTHAELNGHPVDEVCAYFASVSREASDRGFTTRPLSSVVEHSGVRLNSANSAVSLPETLSSLEDCAEKWYRGKGRPSDGAAAYYAMNMHEKRAVELCFPQAIFVTFNSNSLRVLFPDKMPIFYMYSLRKGCAIKPWFMDDEAVGSPALTTNGYM